jgi:hypothetical protein
MQNITQDAQKCMRFMGRWKIMRERDMHLLLIRNALDWMQRIVEHDCIQNMSRTESSYNMLQLTLEWPGDMDHDNVLRTSDRAQGCMEVRW